MLSRHPQPKNVVRSDAHLVILIIIIELIIVRI